MIKRCFAEVVLVFTSVFRVAPDHLQDVTGTAAGSDARVGQAPQSKWQP